MKKQLQKYYNVVCDDQTFRLGVMAREASIQLILQNAVIAYEFLHPPVAEMYYGDSAYPTTIWIALMALTPFLLCEFFLYGIAAKIGLVPTRGLKFSKKWPSYLQNFMGFKMNKNNLKKSALLYREKST